LPAISRGYGDRFDKGRQELVPEKFRAELDILHLGIVRVEISLPTMKSFLAVTVQPSSISVGYKNELFIF